MQHANSYQSILGPEPFEHAPVSGSSIRFYMNECFEDIVSWITRIYMCDQPHSIDDMDLLKWIDGYKSWDLAEELGCDMDEIADHCEDPEYMTKLFAGLCIFGAFPLDHFTAWYIDEEL